MKQITDFIETKSWTIKSTLMELYGGEFEIRLEIARAAYTLPGRFLEQP